MSETQQYKEITIYNDGTFYNQIGCQPDNPVALNTTIKFGPLSTTLSELVKDGYTVVVSGRTIANQDPRMCSRRFKIHLVGTSAHNMDEKYLLGKSSLYSYLKSPNSILDFLNKRVNMDKPTKISSKPAKKKRKYRGTMVGNRTILELVKESMEN